MLVEAFRWGEWRTVTSTAQVNLHGNLYDVDPSLVGARAELVFDPSDMGDIEVRAHSRSYGKAIPSRIRRHVHPKAQAEPAPAPVPTGIDYLRLIEARHTHFLETRLQYAHLDPAGATSSPDPDADVPLADATADTGDGAADDEASRYETDLVALADHPTAASDTADRQLEAELAGFAALLAHHRTDPDTSVTSHAEPDPTSGDSHPDDGTRDDGTREAS